MRTRRNHKLRTSRKRGWNGEDDSHRGRTPAREVFEFAGLPGVALKSPCMTLHRLTFALAAALLYVPARSAEPEWVYLQNAGLKLGVRKDAGACIGFLAGADGKNVL